MNSPGLPQNPANDRPAVKPVFWISGGILSLLLLFLIYALVMSVLSPRNYVLQMSYPTDSTQLEPAPLSPKTRELSLTESFLRARLAMADEDSACLSVNLADSLLWLEMKGVVVHTARILEMEKPPVFDRAADSLVINLFAKPLTVSNAVSTIPKIKYFVKQAPADTTQTVKEPPTDSLGTEKVCFILFLDHGIRIEVLQMDTSGNTGCAAFERKLRRERAAAIFRNLMNLRVPDYHPVYRLVVSADDSRSIYRAIPFRARVAIRP